MPSLERTVIVRDVDGRRWSVIRPRLRDRLLVRWRASTLDARLASGRPAECSRPMAVRADQLVEPTARAELADCWQNVLGTATRVGGTGLRVPVVRSRVLAAEREIRRMIAALRTAAPVPARGVAIARLLLIDGTGPLYNVRSARHLHVAVSEAIRHLNPSTGLGTSLLGSR